MAFIHHAVVAPDSYRAGGQPGNLPKPSTERGPGRGHDCRSTDAWTTV